jgi:N-acetylneuraminate synthase
LGAVALGARVFEKHLTDDNDRSGPDHKFSMTQRTWREMVDRANEVYLALGDGVKRIEENEKDAAIVQRRSLRATADLKAGHRLTIEDLEALRPIPPDGIPPYEINQFIGKALKLDVAMGTHITANHI